MRSALIRPLFLAIVALSALPACGKRSAPDGTEGAAPAADVKPPEPPLDDDALSSVCGEKPEPRAKPFDPKAARIHPLIIFSRADADKAYSIDHPSILDDWKAEDAADYELVACVTKKSRKKINECKFDQKEPARYLDIYEASYEINIHEASTGKKIASKTVDLPAAEKKCPTLWLFRGERGASEPPFAFSVIGLARTFVMPPGATVKPRKDAEPLDDDDLQKVCGELPEVRAEPYAKKDGIQPVKIFERGGETDEYRTTHQIGFYSYKAEEAKGYQLVACVTEKSRTKVKECKYDEKKPARFIDLYNATFKMEIYEAATAKRLASQEVDLKSGGVCPSIWTFRSERDADIPSYDQSLMAFIKPFAGEE